MTGKAWIEDRSGPSFRKFMMLRWSRQSPLAKLYVLCVYCELLSLSYGLVILGGLSFGWSWKESQGQAGIISGVFFTLTVMLGLFELFGIGWRDCYSDRAPDPDADGWTVQSKEGRGRRTPAQVPTIRDEAWSGVSNETLSTLWRAKGAALEQEEGDGKAGHKNL